MKHRHNFDFSPKILLIIFTVLCILLLSVSAISGEVTKPFNIVVGTFITPMQDGINTLGAWMHDRLGSFQTIKELQEENAELKAKVDSLTEANETLSGNTLELEELRELLKLDDEYSAYEKIGARVISNGSGNWYENFVINKGSKDGVAVNMNVLAGTGLVGIVTEVGPNYAKVRSIIDDDSNVSAMALSHKDTCVVRGNSQSVLQDGTIDVVYISKDAMINDGDELVTSNISSKFLPGLRIGTLSDLQTDTASLTKTAKVTPVVDFQHIQNVLVITQLKEVPEGSETAD